MSHLLLLAVGFCLVSTACNRSQAKHETQTSAGESASGLAALNLPAELARLLATGEWDDTPAGFRIIALSFFADGCVYEARHDASKRDAALACVTRILALADVMRPKSESVTANGLWQSHYNLILGARDSLAPCSDEAGHRRLSESLAARSLAEPTRHIPSFAGSPYRWPADQTATLASLWRFDRGHGSAVSERPIREWRQFIEQRAMDRDLELPWSEVMGKGVGAHTPRGCALSWQTRYLHEFAPDLAKRFWESYKKHYLVDRLALIGFREWPPGREHKADIDSGPIVQGVGAAATALAIGAARVMDDDLLAARLEGTAWVVGSVAEHEPTLARAANTVLAASIRYMGAQAVP